MNSKTIYVDFDDVLCETARHFLVVVEREFNKRIAYEELTDFDIEEASRRARSLNAGLEILPISCRSGVGLDAWTEWLTARVEGSRRARG